MNGDEKWPDSRREAKDSKVLTTHIFTWHKRHACESLCEYIIEYILNFEIPSIVLHGFTR